MDLRYPLSPLQAFGIALSTFLCDIDDPKSNGSRYLGGGGNLGSPYKNSVFRGRLDPFTDSGSDDDGGYNDYNNECAADTAVLDGIYQSPKAAHKDSKKSKKSKKTSGSRKEAIVDNSPSAYDSPGDNRSESEDDDQFRNYFEKKKLAIKEKMSRSESASSLQRVSSSESLSSPTSYSQNFEKDGFYQNTFTDSGTNLTFLGV